MLNEKVVKSHYTLSLRRREKHSKLCPISWRLPALANEVEAAAAATSQSNSHFFFGTSFIKNKKNKKMLVLLVNVPNRLAFSDVRLTKEGKEKECLHRLMCERYMQWIFTSRGMHIHNAKWTNGNYAFPYSMNENSKKRPYNASYTRRRVHLVQQQCQRTHVSILFSWTGNDEEKKNQTKTWLSYVFNSGP